MTRKLTTSFYIVLSGRKCRGYLCRDLRAERIIKTTSTLPKTDADEVAICVTVSVPEALFQRPELTVSIDVDGELPRASIDAETMDNLAERMQEIIGTPVHVTCDLPDDDQTEQARD